MARLPQDRYATALEMKKELDHPETVELTGRCDRLVVPNPTTGNARRYLLVVICIAAPVLAMAIAWVYTHLKISIKVK
jgi:hypothetical protein